MDERLMGRLLAVVVVTVAGGWLVAYVVAPLIRSDFHPASEINIPMMAVIGLFLTAYRKARNPDDAREPRSPLDELTERMVGDKEDRHR